MAEKKRSALYVIKKECKGSRRFETKDEHFPIRDVYVERPWCDDVQEFELEITKKK